MLATGPPLRLHESGGRHVVPFAKDDATTSVRRRHPTDRGAPPPLGALVQDGYRSRAYSANASSTIGQRVNVYKRDSPDSPKVASGSPTVANGTSGSPKFANGASGSPKVVNGCGPHHALTTGRLDGSNGSVNGAGSEESPFKRFTMLQRSFKTPKAAIQGSTKHAATGHSPKEKSDSPKMSPLNNIFDFFRGRSNSEGGKQRPSKKATTKETPNAARRQLEPLFVETSHSFVDETGPRHRHALSMSARARTSSSVDDELSPLDEYGPLGPAMRKRSNSDNSNFVILRKTSRPGESEFVASLNTNNMRDDAYVQLLKTFTCYDVMPMQTGVIAFDDSMKVRGAFRALLDNGVRGALYWNSNLRSAVGMVTITDLLSVLRPATCTSEAESLLNATLAACFDVTSPTLNSPSSASNFSFNDHPTLSCSTLQFRSKHKKPWSFVTINSGADLHSAMRVLSMNRIHRLPVIDEESGNVLYFLTTKKILNFMYKHMSKSSLPLSLRMYKTLDQLPSSGRGADGSLVTLDGRASLNECVVKMLDNGLSCIPVLDADTKMLTSVVDKIDIMNYVAQYGWVDFDQRNIADALNAGLQDGEGLIRCNSKTPIVLAIDRLIKENGHRIAVVDNEGRLCDIVSIGTLLWFLTEC